MDRKFRTPFSSIDDQNPVAEINTGISETIPDQTLSVREILQKFANGTLDEISRDAFYNDDVEGYDMPDLRGLDITELHQMKRDAELDIDEINAMIKLQEQEQATGNQEPNPSLSVPPITETSDHI